MELKNRLELFVSGRETAAYEYMGCHPEKRGGKSGSVFRVWAPNAASV